MKLEQSFMDFMLHHQERHNRSYKFLVLLEAVQTAAKYIQITRNLSRRCPRIITYTLMAMIAAAIDTWRGNEIERSHFTGPGCPSIKGDGFIGKSMKPR